VRPWHASPWFLLAQCLPPALLAALYLVVRRRRELARDVGKARRLVAPEAARAGLGAARQALETGDARRFHDALWEAASAYFGNRLNLRPGEVSGPAVAAGLAAAGLDPADVARLGEIFGLLEAERFGRPPRPAAPLPAERRQRLAGLLEEVERLVRACEGPAP
jgi:hypothetical protein